LKLITKEFTKAHLRVNKVISLITVTKLMQ